MMAVALAVLSLTRAEAERDALRTSNQLKAFAENVSAAQEQADAQYATLFPRLTFDASYTYLTNIPTIGVGPATFPFGAHNNYSFGPTLNYTLWDTFAARKAYHGLSTLSQSRDEDRRAEELQLLLEVRSDYVRVQEALEELRAVSDSLNLSRAQNKDIVTRFRAGAASHLDRVESDRDVLNYEIQFTQKQAELSTDLKDLLARTLDRDVADLSHPGPAGVQNVTLELQVDPIQKTLDAEMNVKLLAPDETHPRIRSQELLARSSELQAQSVKATLFPTFQLQARAELEYPNGPIIQQVNQNSVTVNASMSLFEFDRTRHLSQEKLREADSARFQKDQTRIDLQRDFTKAQELLESLRYQQRLAAQDVLNSAEAARLYYQQYQAGKIYLIDVQTANNRALLSKVNKARIDAQILNQLDQLRALSGKEIP